MDKIFTNNVQQAEWEIRNVMKEYAFSNEYTYTMLVTYLLYKASRSIKHDLSYNDVLETMSEEESMLIRDSFSFSQEKSERRIVP